MLGNLLGLDGSSPDVYLINNVPLAPQVAALRNEIEEKQAVIAELKDETQKLSLAFEQLKGEHEKLKEEEQGKSKKLNVSTSLVFFLYEWSKLLDPVN